MLSCTAALHVLKACANMQNMHTVHHFVHLHVNYTKSVKWNSLNACTETKVHVIRHKAQILDLS